MAYHKQAKKRIRQTARRNEVNRSRISRVRTFIKNVEVAIASTDNLGDSTLLVQDNAGQFLLRTEGAGHDIRFMVRNAADTAHEEGLLITADGPVVANFNGIKAFETTANGISIFNTAVPGTETFIGFYNEVGVREGFLQMGSGASTFQLASEVHGQVIDIQGENAVGTMKNMINCDPDGSVDLWFNGQAVPSLLTNVFGAEIHTDGVASSQPALLFFDNTTRTGFLQMGSGGAMHWRSEIHGNNILIEGEDAAGVTQPMIEFDPDGDATIYQDGTLALTVASTGWTSVATGPAIWDMNNSGSTDGTDFRLRNSEGGVIFRVDGGAFGISQSDSLGATEGFWLLGNQDGSLNLYYNALKVLETQDHGFNMLGTTSNADGGLVTTYFDIQNADGGTRGRMGFVASASMVIENHNNSGEILLRAHGSAGAMVSILRVGTTGTSTPQIGFFTTAPVSKPTGVAVDAAGIHAALVTLGLIAA